jgi:hypothetical protein
MISIAAQFLDLIKAYRGDSTATGIIVIAVMIMPLLFTRRGRLLLIDVFRRLTKVKLRFRPFQRGIVWFGTMTDQRFVVSLNGVWTVTNPSKRSVTLKSFDVAGLATEHHMLSVCGSRDSGALVPATESVDVELFCLVQKTLTWGSGDFVADIRFVDDRGTAHTVRKARFGHIKQNIPTQLSGDYPSTRREPAHAISRA